MGELTIKITIAWWLKPYLYGVVITAGLMGLEPDYEKINRTILRALRIRFI